MTTNTTYRKMKQERDMALAECERLRTRHWTILDDMNKSELDAYDLGCAESIAAVDKILDGKDDGSGTNNEPWYTQRKRLLSLTAECERLRADAERKRNMLISIKTFVKHTYPDAETKGVWVEPLRLIDAAIDAARKAKP